MRSYRSFLLAGIVLGVVIVGFWFRHPMLVRYHRWAMVDNWEALRRVSSTGGGLLASVRDFLGLVVTSPVAITRNQIEAHIRLTTKVVHHREALVKLGYFTNFAFPLKPVVLGSKEHVALAERIGAENEQGPVLDYIYDQSRQPIWVVGLTVSCLPEDTGRWKSVAKDLGELGR